MGIGTSDGKYYETEVSMALDLDHMLDPILPNERYNDQPTMLQRQRDGTLVPLHDELKNQERMMEERLDVLGGQDEGNVLKPTPLQVADKQGRGSDLNGPYTPISPKELKDLLWNTPVASSKDPNYTKDDIIETLNWTQEEHNQRFNNIKKELGDRLIDQEPFPAGRVRVRENHPAAKELMKNLPEDIQVHSVGDGTVIFKKKPGDKPPLTS